MNNRKTIIIAVIVGLISISLTAGISYFIFTPPSDYEKLNKTLDDLEKRAFELLDCDVDNRHTPEWNNIEAELGNAGKLYNPYELSQEQKEKIDTQIDLIYLHLDGRQCPYSIAEDLEESTGYTGYSEDPTEPITPPIQEPEPVTPTPTNSLPSNWDQLTPAQKTSLNPFNCAATEWVSAENGNCIDKPPASVSSDPDFCESIDDDDEITSPSRAEYCKYINDTVID